MGTESQGRHFRSRAYIRGWNGKHDHMTLLIYTAPVSSHIKRYENPATSWSNTKSCTERGVARQMPLHKKPDEGRLFVPVLKTWFAPQWPLSRCSSDQHPESFTRVRSSHEVIILTRNPDSESRTIACQKRHVHRLSLMDFMESW
jgi:hypothetical protein